MAHETRLTWQGNLEAERQAAEAFARLKPKSKKARPSKPTAKKRLKKRRKRARRPAETEEFNYKRYLRSSAWKQKRESLFRQRGKECEHCGETELLQVHHLTYRRIGNERLEDLVILCRSCHRMQHHAGKIDRLTREYLGLFQ